MTGSQPMNPPYVLKNFPGMAYRAVNDGQWTIEYLSDGCRDILGLTTEQLQQQGKTRLSDILQHNKNRRLDDLILTHEGGHSFQFDYVLQTATGEERLVVERGLKVFDDTGSLVAIEGFVTEITAPDREPCGAGEWAKSDEFTGLPTQAQFAACYQQALDRLDRENGAHAILFIDLDQSQLMNQVNNPAIGRELLRQVLVCLRCRVRRSDTIARLEGDAIGVLLENCSLEDANHVASVLCNSIEQHDFFWQQRQFSLTASIGVASTSEDLYSFGKLLAAAEIAYYVAKDCGRNRVHYYLQQNAQFLQRNQEIHWALEIPGALADKRFYLEQQIIESVFNTDTEKAWYEILPRMFDMDGKVIMPETFLPASESYNLASMIDCWVIENLLQHFDREPRQLDQVGLCFIGLSGLSLSDPGFLDKLYGMLEQSRVSAEQICFQLTEIAAIRHRESAKTVFEGLRSKGYRIALDDFGNGISSLGLARDFAVDFLKIDDAYTNGIENDPVNRSMVVSIKELAHSNKKLVIAKSVQSKETLKQLRQIGVDFVQGHAIARPGPLQVGLPSNMDRAS